MWKTTSNKLPKSSKRTKSQSTQTKSKKDDWLGRLFRVRDREEREEVYDPTTEELDSDWKYDW